MEGLSFPTYNPATEELLTHVQEAGQADVDRAVQAASDAFEIGSEWRSMGASDRGQLIHKFAQLMRRDEEELAVNKIYWKIETFFVKKCFF